MSLSPTQRLAQWLVQWRWPLLGLALAVCVPAGYFRLGGLPFDRSIENMFAESDPLLEPYRQLKRTFGGTEVVLAAYLDPELMTPEGIDRVDRLTRELKGVEGVASVVSLTTTPLGAKKIIDGSPISREFLEIFEDYTVGADRRTAAVACMLAPEHDSDARDQTIAELRRLVREHDATGVLAGEPVMVVDGFRAIREDGRWLGLISTVLLMLTILICFRSPRWVVISLAIVNFSLLVTEALLIVSGLRLSMVSSMLWAVITVIGIAQVVHVLMHYRETRAAGLPTREALTASLAAQAVPIFWTCLTDAVGFAALLAASVGPVQDFGLMMTLGALLCLVGLVVLVPGLALAGRFDASPKVAWGEHSLGIGLGRLLDGVLRRPWTIGLTSAAICGLALVGSYWVEVETDFTKNFRQSSQIVQAYERVETNLRGAGVWDIVVPAPEQLDHAFLQRLRELDARLEADEVAGPGITKSLSLTQMVDAIPNDPKQWLALLPAGASLNNLPDVVPRNLLPKLVFGGFTPDELALIKLNAIKKFQPDIYDMLHGVDPDQRRPFARVMLRSRERQSSHEKHQLITRAASISEEVFPASVEAPPAQVTGYFVLLANLINSMIRDQWLTFGIASAAIFVMFLAAYQSARVALVAMIPNLLPISLLLGVMGWLGLKLNMGAAMIAAVSVGLSVDSSIHYISDWRKRIGRGEPPADALQSVQHSVGRAATLSTLALMIGFSALCFSDFVPIIYFGVLVSLATFGGLLGNLVLLPLLLHLVSRSKPRESQDAGCGETQKHANA